MFGTGPVTPTPTPTAIASAGDVLTADTVLSAVVALITLVGVIGSIWIARRGQKQDQELAKSEADRAERAQQASEASAERAEAAAALNIDALTRIADALEQPIAEALERSAKAVVDRAGRANEVAGVVVAPFAPPAKVKWSLRHFQGDKYIVENIGDAVAHNVKVSGHESLLQPREWPNVQALGPGEVVEFFALKTMGTVDATITVSWTPSSEEGNDTATWRYPLPPRPPRR